MISRRAFIPYLCIFSGLGAGCAGLPTTTADTPESFIAATQTQFALAAQNAETTASAPTRSPSPPSIATGAALPTRATAEGCTNRGAFVEDVTVRDGMPFVPMERFVKIWRVRNAGTCTWTENYAVRFVGGNQMEAPDRIPLPFAVRPGTELEIAVDMVAPGTPGSYQGYWKFVSDQDTFFGIGPGGTTSFWVKIEVAAHGPAAHTPAATSAFSVAAQGTCALELMTGVDLDTGSSGSQIEDDLRLEALEGNGRLLSPANGAVLGVVSAEDSPATPEFCSMALLDASPVPLTSLSVGETLCFRTSQGRVGALTLTEVGDIVGAEFVTWAP